MPNALAELTKEQVRLTQLEAQAIGEVRNAVIGLQ